MKKKGFTLLEMVLVLAVISLGFLPLVLLFSSGVTASSDVSRTNQAISLVQQKMEAIKNLSFTDVVTSSEAQGTINGFPLFSRSVDVNEDITNLKQVTVRVSWPMATGFSSFEAATLIANY